jgi:membrane fusion protein, multidrug efflux system
MAKHGASLEAEMEQTVTTHARQQMAVAPSDHDINQDAAPDETGETRSASVRAFPGSHGGAPLAVEPADREPRRFVPVLIAVLAVAAAVLTWWLMRSPSSPAATESEVTAPLELAQVDVAAVQPRMLTRLLPLSGSLSPVVQATVKSKVGGEVQQLTVREGQDVREGEAIARLDTRNLQAQYDRELASVEKARADLELATLNREKNRSLLDQKYISQNTFEQTESAYAGSVANVKLAEAQARLAKINLDDAVVRAPFAGTVSRRLVQQGEKVSPDTSIVALVDLRELLLEAAIPAAEIPSVKIGQAARFSVGGFGSRQFEGKVQRINPTTSEGSRAITIYLAVPNPDRALKGGMFAQGDLMLDSTEPVLSIPSSALHFEAGVPIVYTLVDGKIARQQVTIGAQAEGSEFVEVQSGLNAGERVIVASIGDRKPGDAAFVRGESGENIAAAQ